MVTAARVVVRKVGAGFFFARGGDSRLARAPPPPPAAAAAGLARAAQRAEALRQARPFRPSAP